MEDRARLPEADVWPECDCGYRCRGATSEERVRDAQRHARSTHGIEVTADQVRDGGGRP